MKASGSLGFAFRVFACVQVGKVLAGTDSAARYFYAFGVVVAKLGV